MTPKASTATNWEESERARDKWYQEQGLLERDLDEETRHFEENENG